MANSESLVTIDQVSKIFDPKSPPALDKISALIPKGKMIGIAGPDGAGKTTLIRLMAALLHPTEGSIHIDGYDTVKERDQIPFLIGYMPQKFGLYEDLTVQQNLNLYADLQGVENKEREETFKRLLSFTGLQPFQNRLAGALSGGMKQKLGLACALIKKPHLLLLDEPSVGVDPLSRRELWKMVQNLLEEGISVVWSTAYLDEAEKCDDVLLLSEGKLLYKGPPKELTLKLENRTFLIKNFEGRKRKVLSELLKKPEVMDGVVQGDDVRVLLKPNTSCSLPGKVEAVQPRFEDAFVDILGGGPKEESLLAQETPNVSIESEYVVEADHLTKKYGSFTAANEITFKIKQGEIFGLLGPNGAGKSTTFKMMCGLIKPTSGRGLVDGYDLQEAPGKARSEIGYMAQKFSLYGDLSVKQNLEFFSGIYNLKGAQQKEAVDEMTEIFSLQPFLNTNAGELPLGFKQRLALACSTMHHPKILFLDEPTSGVDPITRREFWNHINGLVEKGVTIMVTTHFMDEAEYCDRIGLVYQSKMIKLGTPEQLKKETGTPTLEEAFIHLIEGQNGNGR